MAVSSSPASAYSGSRPGSRQSALSAIFKNFDSPPIFTEYLDKALSLSASNFAVRFGIHDAEIATNLETKDVHSLLDHHAHDVRDSHEKFPVAWINIWSTSENVGILSAIGKHYNFSTRLQSTIRTWDTARAKVNQTKASRTSCPVEQQMEELMEQRGAISLKPRPKHGSRHHDPEQFIESIGRPATRKGKPEFHPEDVRLYDLLQSTYNYTTTDHGPNFLCIGANWLHDRASPDSLGKGDDVYKESAELVPPKHWAWYILTTNGVVISIHEAPHFDTHKESTEELRNMRKNIRDLLSQLSNCGMKEYKHRVLSSKGVRSDWLEGTDLDAIRTAHDIAASTPTYETNEQFLHVDGAANLFYYLFEDYTVATQILAKSKDILAHLANDILHISDRKNKNRDNSYIIKTLYTRSKDLRQLKHLFKSYQKLLTGIMDLPIESRLDSPGDKPISPSAGYQPRTRNPTRGVRLSQKAVDRFARLNERIRLLMLDMIDEYLEEKTSLSGTYFNLLAQKDSQATYKLNQSASLLAKLSVFFLPLSFMTSYFSVQIPDLTNNVSGKTYWVAFAVIATLAFLNIFFLGQLMVGLSDLLGVKLHNLWARTWMCVRSVLWGRKRRAIGDSDIRRKSSEYD